MYLSKVPFFDSKSSFGISYPPNVDEVRIARQVTEVGREVYVRDFPGEPLDRETYAGFIRKPGVFSLVRSMMAREKFAQNFFLRLLERENVGVDISVLMDQDLGGTWYHDPFRFSDDMTLEAIPEMHEILLGISQKYIDSLSLDHLVEIGCPALFAGDTAKESWLWILDQIEEYWMVPMECINPDFTQTLVTTLE